MNEQPKQAPWWQPGLILFSKLSTWIAIPILLALFIGKYLDKKLGTEPWLFLSFTGVSFIISTIGLVMESSKAMKKIEAADAEAKAAREEELAKKLAAPKDTENKQQ